MRRRQVLISVSDHAVLRWLERRMGLDVEAIRAHLAGQARTAAELDAAAVVVDRVRLMLRPELLAEDDPIPGVTITTVTLPAQRIGLGADDGRRVRRKRIDE